MRGHDRESRLPENSRVFEPHPDVAAVRDRLRGDGELIAAGALLFDLLSQPMCRPTRAALIAQAHASKNLGAYNLVIVTV